MCFTIIFFFPGTVLQMTMGSDISNLFCVLCSESEERGTAMLREMIAVIARSKDIKRKVRAFSPSFSNTLEERNLLTTVVATAGDYRVTVTDDVIIPGTPIVMNGDIRATLEYKGKVVKSNIAVATDPNLHEENPSVSISTSGNFVVSYQTRAQSMQGFPPSDISMKGFDSRGNQVFADVVASTASNEVMPRTLIYRDKTLIVAYGTFTETGTKITVAQYNLVLRPTGLLVQRKTYIPVVASNNSNIIDAIAFGPPIDQFGGRWILSYTSYNAVTDKPDVMAYVYNTAGRGRTFTIAATGDIEDHSRITSITTAGWATISYDYRKIYDSTPVVKSSRVRITQV